MINKKKVLITGNLGYVGSVLTDYLSADYNIIGLDIGYFQNCKVHKIRNKKRFKQIIKDIDKIKKKDLKNIESIIHLASLSNDPLGELNKNSQLKPIIIQL